MPLLFLTALVILLLVLGVATAHRVTHPPRKTYAVALARELPTDPQSVALDGDVCRFRLPDDQWTDGFDLMGRNPDGPVVIFTHGWSDSRFGALTWAPAMADFISRLVVYDLRGHGDSPDTCSHLGAREGHDLCAIIDQVATETELHGAGSRPLVLWGHSLGALITLIAASDANAPPIGGIVLDGLVRSFSEAVFGRLRLMRMPARIITPLAMGTLALWDSRIVRLQSSEAASRVSCPMLMMHGAMDPIAPLKSAQTVAAGNENARFIVFPEGGHGNLAMSGVEQHRAALAQFFEEISACPSRLPSTTPS